MNLRKLGNTGLVVSDLCLGTMNFGMPDWGVDEKAGLEVFHAFFDAGGNFIDTADVYCAGVSEQICAKAISGRRDKTILATKGSFPVVMKLGDPPAHPNAYGNSRRHLTQALEDSLRRLETDYVDLYQVHCWDPRTPIEETLSTLDGFIKSGKVRYVGLSNFEAWQIAESRQLCIRHGWEPFVSAQMQYSLANREIERGVIPVCDRYGIGVLPWSPLGGGVLTGKYGPGQTAPPNTRFGPETDQPNTWRRGFHNERNIELGQLVCDMAGQVGEPAAAVAVAWLLRRPMVSSVIIGPKTVQQFEDNLAAKRVEFSSEQLEQLDRASRPHWGYPEKFIARSSPQVTWQEDRTPRLND